MNAFYIILAASAVLGAAAFLVFLVFIVVGVRRGDRRDLRSPANDRIDAFTRRVVGVGGSNDADNKGGES